MWRPLLLVVDPKLGSDILQRRPDVFERSEVINLSARHGHPSGKVGVFSSRGEDWKEQRRLISPAFTPTAVRTYFDVIQRTLSEVEEKIKRESVVTTTHAQLFALDVILQFAYNVRLTDVNGERIRKLSTDVLTATRDRLAGFGNMLRLWATPLWRLMPSERYLRYQLRPEFDKVVKTLLENHEDSGFLSRISDMDPDLRVLNSETVLIAGHETTASTANWILNLFARDPSLRARVKQEVLRVSPQGWQHLTQNDVQELLLTQRVVSEVLRLKSPAPLIGFTSIADYEGTDSQGRRVFIPKGSNGFVMTRFIDMLDGSQMDLDSPEPHKYQAFGGGPRICPGKALALTELVLWTAMVSSLNLVAPNKAEPQELTTIAMGPSEFEVRVVA